MEGILGLRAEGGYAWRRSENLRSKCLPCRGFKKAKSSPGLDPGAKKA